MAIKLPTSEQLHEAADVYGQLQVEPDYLEEVVKFIGEATFHRITDGVEKEVSKDALLLGMAIAMEAVKMINGDAEVKSAS